jgi:hypothetical protein
VPAGSYTLDSSNIEEMVAACIAAPLVGGKVPARGQPVAANVHMHAVIVITAFAAVWPERSFAIVPDLDVF